jgi:hypothetical protein
MMNVLTEADYLVVPSTTMDHVACERVVCDGPYQLQRCSGDFPDVFGAPEGYSRKMECVWINSIRSQYSPTISQPRHHLIFDVKDKMLSADA